MEPIRLSSKRLWQSPNVNRLKQSHTRIVCVEYTSQYKWRCCRRPYIHWNCQISLEGQCENTFTNMSATRFRAWRYKYSEFLHKTAPGGDCSVCEFANIVDSHRSPFSALISSSLELYYPSSFSLPAIILMKFCRMFSGRNDNPMSVCHLLKALWNLLKIFSMIFSSIVKIRSFIPDKV